MAVPTTITMGKPYILVSQNIAALDILIGVEEGYSIGVIEKINTATVGWVVGDKVLIKMPKDNLNIIVKADNTQYAIIKEEDIILKDTFTPS